MAAPAPGKIAVYVTADGEVRVDVRLDRETVWLTQEQMGQLFGRERSVITKHIRNVFAEGELVREAVCAKFAHTAADGKTYRVEYYNLDVIISVGYRVKSLQGTRFRQWATRVLREHLVRGYTLHRQRFERNARELEAALALVRKAAAGEALTTDQGRGLVDVIARYAQTFLWLQRYDEGVLAEPKGAPGGTLPTAQEARAAIARLKVDLMARGEASDLFGRERDDALAALLGNLDQTVLGAPAYPTVESKAAHLLYFAIKEGLDKSILDLPAHAASGAGPDAASTNQALACLIRGPAIRGRRKLRIDQSFLKDHPFADGNKRIGSLLFVDFLNRSGRLFRDGEAVINDVGLAALALLVAESDAKSKDVMIRLSENMLAGPQP